MQDLDSVKGSCAFKDINCKKDLQVSKLSLWQIILIDFKYVSEVIV